MLEPPHFLYNSPHINFLNTAQMPLFPRLAGIHCNLIVVDPRNAIKDIKDPLFPTVFLLIRADDK